MTMWERTFLFLMLWNVITTTTATNKTIALTAHLVFIALGIIFALTAKD